MSRPVPITLAFTVTLLWALACQYEAPLQSESSINHPPSAKFVYPSTVAEGFEAAFDARPSRDYDGDRLQYAWTFGDGATAEGAAPHHRYDDDCLCTVQLVVTDSHGETDTARVTVDVQNVAPRFDGFTLSVSATPVGAPITARAAVYDPGRDDSLTVTIDWGDDELSDGTTHAYRRTGSYVVTATVRDDDDGILSLPFPSRLLVYDPSGRESGYEAIALGTLGGQSSKAIAFNDNGQVVGESETGSGRTHAFLWENGVMRDITGPYNLSSAHVITDGGTVGGIAIDSVMRVFLWNNGTVSELGRLGNASGRGSLVGLTNTAVVGWRGASIYYNSSIWQNGVQRELGSLGAAFPYAEARAMNYYQQVVGTALIDYPPSWLINHAFVWESGTMRDLGVLFHFPCPTRPSQDCGASEANDINTGGEIAGASRDANNQWHAVRWAHGTIQDLGFGWAKAINDRGDVVINGTGQAFFWREGTRTALGSFGSNYVYVVDVNDQGVAIGMSMTADMKPHVFIWEPERATLTDLGLPSGFDGGMPVAINSRGDVIGYAWANAVGVNPRGPTRAVLWRRNP